MCRPYSPGDDTSVYKIALRFHDVRLVAAKLVKASEMVSVDGCVEWDASRQGEVEDDLLDRAWGLTHLSRLSCQAFFGQEEIVIEIPKYSINHAKENH